MDAGYKDNAYLQVFDAVIQHSNFRGAILTKKVQAVFIQFHLAT